MRLLVPRALATVALALAPALAACGDPPADSFTRPVGDGSVGDGGDAGFVGREETGAPDPTLGGPCTDDAQCDDGIACTFQRCDHDVGRCRYTPDDAQCDDGIYCNGREVCVVRRGCAPGGVVACDDGTPCTLDRCVESTKACVHEPRDADGDGQPDDRCVTGKDCDDADPLVSNSASEICGNGKDDNCNGAVDEVGCVTPEGDTCASPVALGASGSYLLSTRAAARDYTSGCSLPGGGITGRDVVARFTVPAGTNADAELWVSGGFAQVSAAVQRTCGSAVTEITCNSGGAGVPARVRARDLSPGDYFVVVTTEGETSVDLSLDLGPVVPKATNETCGNGAPLTPDVPVTVSIVDAAKELPTACALATGELTYSFTLASPADVRIFASTLKGGGSPVVSLRNSTCVGQGDELRCRTGAVPPLYARNLPAGTYIVGVGGTAALDANLLLKTYPPTSAPADQTCATAPPATVNGTLNFTLVDHEDAIKDECLAGWPNAAFALPLAQASDVLLVARFAGTGSGSVSMGTPTCDATARIACSVSSTPSHSRLRNVPAGDYRVVVGDTTGQAASLSTFVRPTVAPTAVSGAEACASAVDIPEGGGFFTGDTSNANADFDMACDAPGQSGGGAADQVLRLVLTQRRRVVFSMEGSSYTTILDVRSGPTCPGVPLQDACYVGYTGLRSFLDRFLDPGTYWVFVDGYAGSKGAWNLDVHTTPP